ncbi:hypothetical protein [Pseudonocardia ammonioxydans]|nr:hypothetical protein [Pseudonocardia ammonioxydans]
MDIGIHVDIGIATTVLAQSDGAGVPAHRLDHDPGVHHDDSWGRDGG